MHNTYTITITMDGYGNFTYSPSTLNAKKGDLINWSSDSGAFAISFSDHTPFDKVSFSSASDGQGSQVLGPIKVREHTIGHHHYAVALARTVIPDSGGPTTEVVLDSGCPDIVVSDN